MSGKLIVFEGVDCSFKEYNSKILNSYLNGNNEKTIICHFPRYDNPSSYFIKEYLSGNYGDTKKFDSDYHSMQLVSSFYMMDMFDYMEKIGKPALDDGINVILDRYYYSNMYYRLASNDSLRAFSMNKIIFDVEVLAKAAKLPKADIVIKMISNKKMLENILASKENKDSNEEDIDYMLKVQSEFNIFDFKELLANGGKQIDIHICGKDGIPFEKNIIYANIITEVRGVLDAK